MGNQGQYDFDSVIDRRGTNSVKWDCVEERFGLKGLLPMWIADMDFRSPIPVIDALKRVSEQGLFGYAAVTPQFHQAVIDWMRRRHDWDVKREWIVFSPGVVPAINIMVKAFTEPGDEVVVQPPVYHPFFYAIERNDRRVLRNPLRIIDGEYRMDLADLEEKLTPRTKMVLLCSPHNPVGRVWRAEELRELGNLCVRHKLIVVADEIHHDLVYPGFKHTVFPTAGSGLEGRTLVCTGASKTFNLPGLHTSSIIIPDPKLREHFSAVAQASALGGPNPFGIAATEAAYRECEEWLIQLLRYLKGNLDFVNNFTRERMVGPRIAQPQGTYLLWLDFRGTGMPAERLSRFACSEAGVALDPGRLFGADEEGFERMNIACPRATLEEGLRRIERAVHRI
ncbi:MAG: pyridoxal phosphate-dependent aminotransferase [Chloroflexi bacterium]|nr:pyridoxal phosphate-dependent aminotransferase [Chloroflexota bacterium]